MVRYWKIGFTMGGGGDVWDEFVEQGLASIGWGWKLGDLREYKDQLEMYEEWKRLNVIARGPFINCGISIVPYNQGIKSWRTVEEGYVGVEL